MNTHDTPTAEELARVAAYWRRVEDLACEHETIRYVWGEPPTCDPCGHPVSILSDVQIEGLIEANRGKVGAR